MHLFISSPELRSYICSKHESTRIDIDRYALTQERPFAKGIMHRRIN